MKSVAKVLALLAVMGLVTAAWAAEKKEGEVKPLRGKVVSVAVDGKVTVSVGKEATAKEVIVATDAATVVEIDGKAATVADLKAGMMVMVTPPEGTAKKIMAHTAIPKKGGDEHK